MNTKLKAFFALAAIAMALTATQSPAQSTYEPYTFTALAGGTAALFNLPNGVAVDSAGNVYVADTGNSTIWKVTPVGVVTTLAGMAGNWGSVDGTGSDAQFNTPSGVAVDSAGNVYVADSGNNTIRKVTSAGVVTTLAGMASQYDNSGYQVSDGSGSADGTGSDARFNNPSGVAVDSAGNVYVADSDNFTIRKVTPTGAVTTLAGLAGSPGSEDGTGTDARFGTITPGHFLLDYFYTYHGPSSVAVDNAGNVYVADTGNFTIRKVTADGVVTTLAGLAGNAGSADGTGTSARFGYWFAFSLFGPILRGPSGVTVDGAGNVYVSDAGNNTIRRVTAAGVVTALAGLAQLDPNGNPVFGSVDGTGTAARFNAPSGVAVDSAGNVYVADSGNNTIRKGYPALKILNSGSGFGFNGGHFGFNLTGPAGQTVVVEASTDLVNWLPIWTNTFAGALNFSDPQSSATSHRFYRSRTP